MTEAERKLWSRLRSGQLGVKFRRQVPIDRYIADFACIEARLVVEVDGGQHNIDIASDRARTAVLETAEYLVIRFWNHEVLKDIDGVVERIAGTLAAGTSSGD
jgi:very-short-patch-repair endonuclease